jgi:hypothetical protein
MPDQHRSEEVRAVDIQVGDDGDAPGISQELTTDDIDDIAFDPNLTVGERRERLMELHAELDTRRFGDIDVSVEDTSLGDQDMKGIFTYLIDRIASLGNATVGDAELAATGMDTDDRSDDDDPADHVDDEDEEARIEDLSRRTI